MELGNKIKCVLMDFKINKITLQESTQRLLLLLEAAARQRGRSELFKCPTCCDTKVKDNGDYCAECEEIQEK